jgi:type IV secretory pathway VirB10-like protein
MNTLSEFLPFILIIAFVLISIRKRKSQQEQEEMAKTTLPGHTSGEIITPSTRHPQPFGRKHQPFTTAHKPTHQAIQPTNDLPTQPEENETQHNEPPRPLLDLENTDEVTKAILYTEIFNRKAY